VSHATAQPPGDGDPGTGPAHGNHRKAVARFRADLDGPDRDNEAARLYHAERLTWQEVADRLGFSHRRDAQRASERSLHEARAVPTQAMIAGVLAAIDGDDAVAAAIVYGPKRYKTSVTGKLIEGPDGEPLEDSTEIQQAIMVRHKLRQQRIDLLGLAAPKRSVHATVDLDAEHDTVMAELVQAYQRRDAERERELADLRAQLAHAQDPARPALTVLAGKTEQAGRS
jgi:hypothetical protein